MDLLIQKTSKEVEKLGPQIETTKKDDSPSLKGFEPLLTVENR